MPYHDTRFNKGKERFFLYMLLVITQGQGCLEMNKSNKYVLSVFLILPILFYFLYLQTFLLVSMAYFFKIWKMVDFDLYPVW